MSARTESASNGTGTLTGRATEPEVTTTLAADAVNGTDPVGIPSLMGAVADIGAALTRLDPLKTRGRKYAGDLVAAVKGKTPVPPDRKDWRFTDPTWSENPLYRRVGQSYLATCAFVDAMIDDLGRDGRPTEKARFLANVLASAAAPTNTLLGNPPALKRALETGGASLYRGGRNFLSDLRHNGGLPSSTDRTAFTVARDLAVTPGSVVDRDEFGEVIQYTPATATVRSRPVLIVPPPIGRFYFLDLRPGRSFVEHAVGQGLQTFMLSWRNPTKGQSDWDLETYARRVLSAIDAVRDITGSEDVNVIGFCAGGILMTLVLNHLAALGDDRVHSASYAVTLLDFGQRAPIAAFSSPKLLSFARWNSGRSGIISARSMGAVFTWMRPNELVWNYWVNNYLLGNDPPVFDILAWNADGTNLPAALHRNFLDIFETNVLCRPGALTVLGTPLDLASIKVPTFVTGASTDHLTPWTGCYRTTQLLSGPSEFVLSNSGHIQSLVNPPGNPKASYFAGGELAPTAEQWLAGATKHSGTWWTYWTDWVTRRSGEEVPAPRTLGNPDHPPLDDAPGLYVRDRTPADR